jgi:hypothetical protein
MRYVTVGRHVSPIRAIGLALLAASVVAVSCAPVRAADDDDYGLNPSWSDKLSESMKEQIGKAEKAVGFGRPSGPAPIENPSGCPPIAILDGTEAQRVMAPGATGNTGLKYQYSLFSVARECSMAGGRMSVKIGAGGRVLLGPAGAAGRFDVPIRVVVFSEIDHKPVQSKLFRVSASVGSGQASAPFQFVSDQVVVPIASGRTGDDYSIKVGIDGKGGPDVGAAKPARHHKKKDVATASQ